MVRKMMLCILAAAFWAGLCGISAAQQGFHGYKEYGVFIQDYSWTEELDDGTTQRVQYVLADQPGAKIYALGYTVADVESKLTELGV